MKLINKLLFCILFLEGVLVDSAYSEVIFFQDADAFNRFTGDKFEFSAQASAVALTAGASFDVDYRNGILVFTHAKGGLMYEASVGGQKFKTEMR